MNFLKNLFRSSPNYCYFRFKIQYNRKVRNISLQRTVLDLNLVKYQKLTKRKNVRKVLYSTYNADISEIEELVDLYPYLPIQHLSNSDIARSVLYKNSNDPKIKELEKCASVEEVFSFVRKNSADLNYKHLTQIILVLSDLQNMFLYHLDEDTDAKDFFRKLLEHQEFYAVLSSINKNLNVYDPLYLSYTSFYLNKLGLPVENDLIQTIIILIKNHLLNDKFSLDVSARFLRVVFQENSVRPYFTAIDIIPKVFNQIGSIQTLKDMEDLTVCLNMLSNVITEDVMDQYLKKVNEFIDNKKLTGANYHILLKILSLFKNPNFRNKNVSFIAECILLMKESIELMNFRELDVLYQIFFKCQEPGEILNTIQRASAKILHEQDDIQLQRETQLKLFSCLIYFSSPNHKMQFRKDITKYIKEKETLNSLLHLEKIYSYLKISDVKLCDLYWTKACEALKELKDFDKTAKLYENYWAFLSDNPSYRFHAFEHYVLKIIQSNFESVFCNDLRVTRRFMEYFKANQCQMVSVDVLKVSQVLNLMWQKKNVRVSKEEINDIKDILKEVTAKLYIYNENFSIHTMLIKAAIVRNDFDNELINEILLNCKNIKYMSSKMLENLSFSLFAPKALIPEIMNKCTEYVVRHKAHILGFNAEKILFLCYYLNYYPVYAEEFFQSVIDVILRDQERLSGLSFLQAALSLCYFNHLPKSFVKQIFNVEFLDKLDVELENCYYRDSYPQRVRNTLMQLNRAVCLEYPQFNVPWFHQKYIDELQKLYAKDDISVNVFQRSVRNYLMGVIDNKSIIENVLVPYGYHINFVIYFDKYSKPTSNLEDASTLKLAVLLKNDNAFTRFYIRLKGKHELQNKHLEILGYKVKIIKWNEWANLLYASERIDFIRALVFS